jgi:hypothetical protein
VGSDACRYSARPGPGRDVVNPMRTRREATIEDLRQAVDCLPRDTRVAMLTGIAANPIIAGAYSDVNGICPMLAAHRNGGRTSQIAFANAWDRFVFRGARKHRARRATERELLILRTHLEASLLDDGGPVPEFSRAIAEHRELLSRPRPAPAKRPERSERPGDPDRSAELRRRGGWAWLRVFRRYDDYERALARVNAEAAGNPQPRDPELSSAR